MCRLVDSEALGAAGFERVRKAELDILTTHARDRPL